MEVEVEGERGAGWAFPGRGRRWEAPGMAAAPVPRNTGPKWGEGIDCSYSLRRQGTWSGRNGAMAWRMALLGSSTWRRWGIQAAKHTRARRRGLLLPELAPLHGSVLGWLYMPRRRPSAAVDRGLWPIAAFGLRPPSTVDRGLRPPL